MFKNNNKTNRYQDYVIKDGKFIGDFEKMYQNCSDPWEQSEREIFASEKAACTNLIEAMSFKSVVEIGCGFGQFTNQLNQVADNVIGFDISPTAINQASMRYPHCKFEVSSFPDFERLRTLKPDCIVMAEVTWYVLDELDSFLHFLRTEMPETYLMHMLMTYKKGEQKYGADKFTNLYEIKKYFDMNYIESGEVERPDWVGGRRTYFLGRYA